MEWSQLHVVSSADDVMGVAGVCVCLMVCACVMFLNVKFWGKNKKKQKNDFFFLYERIFFIRASVVKCVNFEKWA